MLRIVTRLPSKDLRTKSRRFLQFKLYKSIRPYAKDICPPPDKSGKKGKAGGSGVGYAIGALALFGGATIGYAKYDPDFRNTLTEYVPWTDDIIKFVFQEEFSLVDYASSTYDSTKQKLSEIITDSRKEEKAIKHDDKPYKAPQPIVPALEDTKIQPENYTEIRVEQKEKGKDPHVEIDGAPCEPPIPAAHPINLAELEQKFCEAATASVNAYNEALYDLRVYNQEIAALLEKSLDSVDQTRWETIKTKTRAKNESICEAERRAKEASQNVARLKALITKETAPATKKMLTLNIERIQGDVDEAKSAYESEKKVGSVTEKYWEKVQKARLHFCEELEALYPSIDIYNKKMDIDETDLDLFIVHAYTLVLYYQKELARLETIAKTKLQTALDSYEKSGNGEPLHAEQICKAIEEETRRLTLCFQQQCLKLRIEAEHDLREQLRRQSQVFTDHLEEAVKTRAAEIERSLTRKYDEEFEREKLQYKKQLATMVGRMKGLDHALKVRDASDKASKQSQVLWSACQALLRAIKNGCPGVPWKDQLRPLNPELALVQKAAAKGDELVEAVLEGIPNEAKTRGVFPEDALRERFLKVESVARKVALVSEDGGRLPLYLLSHIQSWFLIKNPSPIPQAELNDEKVDFTKLSTNEILQRARYWMDRGDLSQTLKYMNLLKGAPRSIARQWMYETKILLETQQAADTLMAHAASSGLLHL